MNIINNVTVAGTGLWAAQTLQAEFLRASKSYNPDIDPRLPKHTVTSSLLVVTPNTAISTTLVLGNINMVPQVTTGNLGYLRVGGTVWSYANVHTANATVSGLANVQVRPVANVAVGTVVSVLGLRTTASAVPTSGITLVGYIDGITYFGLYHVHEGRKMTGSTHTTTFHRFIYDTVEESLANLGSGGPASSSSSGDSSGGSGSSGGGSSGGSGGGGGYY